jgi:iron complex outermembrane receptor protein
MKLKHLLGTTALAMACSSLAIPLAHAQQASSQPAADSGGIEEVVVTARQRSENEVDVPISLQAFSKDQLEAANITDLNSLQYQAGFTFQQGVSTQGGGREFPALIMRGLQSTYGGDNSNSGSVFVDGIYVSAGLASINTADVSQVEVLKGPQNVYFGKNTFGGAINYITSNPSDEFEGSVEASGSERGDSNLIATIEGPLVEGLLDGRLMVEDYHKAAQYHATDGGDLGEEGTKSITGVLYATPSKDLWLRFRVHYQQDDDSAADLGFIQGTALGDTLTQCENVGHGTTATGANDPVNLVYPYFCTGKIPSLAKTGTSALDQNTFVPPDFAQALATNDWGGVSDPLDGKVPKLDHSGLRRDILELAFQAGYDLPDNFNFAFNAGYNKDASYDIWDLDRSNIQNYINGQPIVSNDLTIDARITSDPTQRLRALLGVSYFHSLYEVVQDDDNFYGQSGPEESVFAAYYSGPSLQTGNYVHETDSTKAIYGSLDFDITDWLTATAEARYQHDTVTDTNPYIDAPTLAKFDKSFDNFLPRFILKAHPQDDWTFYASYSEGVQPTNLQSGYIALNPAQQAYVDTALPGTGDYTKQATLDSWEIGAKQVLFDNRFQYGLALYDEKWNNQQTSVSVFNPSTCTVPEDNGVNPLCPLPYYGTSAYISNQARVKGIEFSGDALITDNWSADIEVDYKNAVWDKYFNNTLSNWTGGVSYFNGNDLSRVPKLSGVLSSTYRDHLVGDWNWYIRGQVTYTGSMYADDVNIGKTSAYARVNASLGFTKGNLNLELYAKNLFDDKNWDWASRVPSLVSASDNETFYNMGVLVQAPDRRDFGVKLNYKF